MSDKDIYWVSRLTAPLPGRMLSSVILVLLTGLGFFSSVIADICCSADVPCEIDAVGKTMSVVLDRITVLKINVLITVMRRPSATPETGITNISMPPHVR